MHERLARDYARAVDADRRAIAARRRPPADAGDLERLIATAAAGDQMAWQALVVRFGPQMLRTARALGLSRAQAEDAVQETWMRLMRTIDRIREPEALGAWLRTTVRRESQRVRERSQREALMTDDPRSEIVDASTPDAQTEVTAAEWRAAIDRAFATLPARHGSLMRTLFGEAGLSYEEIADRVGMPIGSIGPIRGRCLARLRLDANLRQLADELD